MKYVIASYRGPTKETFTAFVEAVKENMEVRSLRVQSGEGCFNIYIDASKEDVERLTWMLMPARFRRADEAELTNGEFLFTE
jgi:hypothetical protein